MPTRRRFIGEIAGTFAAIHTGYAVQAAARSTASSAADEKSASRIRSAICRNDTTVRLGGDCLVGAMSWASDDSLLVAALDGAGWPKTFERHYSSKLWRFQGGRESPRVEEVPGYPQIPLWELIGGNAAPYYSMGMLAVDQRIYQYLSTYGHWARPDEIEKSEVSGLHFNGAKLIYSDDNGRTWRNQDGSSPVIRETFEQQSKQSMVFLREPQDAFAMLSFLQMGKSYEQNRDDYVYVYSPNGGGEGTMNELVVFRVPKAKVPERAAYEYFAGLGEDGAAHWVKELDARKVVHTFPSGWVPEAFPMGWVPSVAYIAPLNVYLMAAGNATGGDCKGYKPTYLGLWVAAQPWGPWRQIYEDKAWHPGNDAKAYPGWPQIVPKWIAADGKSFWLGWADCQQVMAEDVFSPMYHAQSQDEFTRARARWGQVHPYFGFNAQRFDLAIS